MQLSSLWSVKEEFRTKVILLALTFSFLTGTQAVWRSLKASVFAKIVGAAYTPNAKIYSIFFLIPLILIYSKLVDVLRRHQLVYFFTIFHGAIGLIFVYFLAHPTIGLSNTLISPHRWLGWIFYLFMESFSAFLSTTFWAFANSINKPSDAKNHYGLFVAGSKIGGIFAAGALWIFLSIAIQPKSNIFTWLRGSTAQVHDATILPFALFMGSMMLFGAALCIYFLMKKVPGYYMHGYEAVYKVEKKREQSQTSISIWQWLTKATDGLRAILTKPYVLGIFSLALFHDIIMTIFDFYVLMSADASYNTAGKMALFYAGYFLVMHSIGLIITLFGTTPIQRLLGNRMALLIYPTLCMVLVLLTFFFPTTQMFFISIVLLRAFNYGLNHPIREVLYIPTTKEIKFKAKAWSDAFGTRIAKGGASFFYKNVMQLSPAFGRLISTSFTFSITFIWIVVSYFLGRTLQRAIDHKEVIGDTKEARSS